MNYYNVLNIKIEMYYTLTLAQLNLRCWGADTYLLGSRSVRWRKHLAGWKEAGSVVRALTLPLSMAIAVFSFLRHEWGSLIKWSLRASSTWKFLMSSTIVCYLSENLWASENEKNELYLLNFWPLDYPLTPKDPHSGIFKNTTPTRLIQKAKGYKPSSPQSACRCKHTLWANEREGCKHSPGPSLSLEALPLRFAPCPAMDG